MTLQLLLLTNFDLEVNLEFPKNLKEQCHEDFAVLGQFLW